MDDSYYRCKDCDLIYKSGESKKCPHLNLYGFQSKMPKQWQSIKYKISKFLKYLGI